MKRSYFDFLLNFEFLSTSLHNDVSLSIINYINKKVLLSDNSCNFLTNSQL